MNSGIKKIKYLLLVLGSILPCESAWSQDAPAPFEIVLESSPEVSSGKVAQYTAFSDEKGPIMTLDNLEYFQPVSVIVFAENKGDDFLVTINKDDEIEPNFSENTGEKGYSLANFRTQGGIIIKVVSSSGRKPFRFIAWVGPIIHPPLPPITQPVMGIKP